MLGAGAPVRRLIDELVEQGKRAAYPELLLQPPPRRLLIILALGGVAAATVAPIERPEPFGGASLLNENFTPLIEQENRKGAMQKPFAIMAFFFFLVADDVVPAVHESKLCHGDLLA